MRGTITIHRRPSLSRIKEEGVISARVFEGMLVYITEKGHAIGCPIDTIDHYTFIPDTEDVPDVDIPPTN